MGEWSRDRSAQDLKTGDLIMIDARKEGFAEHFYETIAALVVEINIIWESSANIDPSQQKIPSKMIYTLASSSDGGLEIVPFASWTSFIRDLDGVPTTYTRDSKTLGDLGWQICWAMGYDTDFDDIEVIPAIPTSPANPSEREGETE